MFKNRYRIVKDSYCGYEAQVKLWYWPFSWHQYGGTNTHTSAESAEQYILNRGNIFVKEVFL